MEVTLIFNPLHIPLSLSTATSFLDNEQLAKSGMNCLENLVMGAGHSFKEADWDLIIDTITDVYAQTLPADMRIWKPTLDTSFDQVR